MVEYFQCKYKYGDGMLWGGFRKVGEPYTRGRI